MTISLTIPAVTLSQNVLDRMHWSARHRYRNEWYWLVKIAVRKMNVDQQPCSIAKRVHIIRVGVRLIDDQNIPSGCKYLLDALVKEDLLYDDSRKWCRVTFDQRKCGKGEEPHMEISIEDAE